MDSHGGRSSEFLNHYFLHESSKDDFNSSQQMSRVGMHRPRSEAENEVEFSAGDEDDEAGFFFRPPGKKRRLSPEQVKHLEKSFAVDNKLESERKTQIAKELGLQPRQTVYYSLLQERNMLQDQVSALRTLQNITDGGPLVSLNRRPAPEKSAAEVVFDGGARSGAGLPELEGQASYWPWFY